MIVGGYSTHLYCDCEACTAEEAMRYYRDGFGDFCGQTFKETVKYAKLSGWKFSADMTKCFAPKHKIPRS